MVYKGNPLKIDDLGVPLFQETAICLGMHIAKFGGMLTDQIRASMAAAIKVVK